MSALPRQMSVKPLLPPKIQTRLKPNRYSQVQKNNLHRSTPPDISADKPLSIDVARIGPDEILAVIAGTAPPETEIRLLDTDQPLSKTLSNSNGEWVAIPDQPLSAGNHLIIAEMTGKDGQIIRSERGVLIELAENGNEKPLVALVPMTGDAATEILSAPRELASTNILQSGASGDSATDTASILAQKDVEIIFVALPAISIGTLSWHSANILEIKGQSVGGASHIRVIWRAKIWRCRAGRRWQLVNQNQRAGQPDRAGTDTGKSGGFG